MPGLFIEVVYIFFILRVFGKLISGSHMLQSY